MSSVASTKEAAEEPVEDEEYVLGKGDWIVSWSTSSERNGGDGTGQ